MKRNTSKLMLAATTARPKRMKIKLKMTYPGLLESAWSFCRIIYLNHLSVFLARSIKHGLPEERRSRQNLW